jgi:hypothetical protein
MVPTSSISPATAASVTGSPGRAPGSSVADVVVGLELQMAVDLGVQVALEAARAEEGDEADRPGAK